MGSSCLSVVFAAATAAKVWSEAFGARLALREPSYHQQCAICCRHKMLIKKLTGDTIAQSHQMYQFQQHLRQQYGDRCCYWSARTTSRLPMSPTGHKSICIITDAIDHNKFRYPRSKIFTSKEFSSYIRPTMDCTAVLAHGHHLLLALSEPWVPKDSSWCCELLLHSLHRLSCSGCDLRATEILLQSDNCSRECKNNSLVRLAGILTGLHMVRRFEMRFLMTGHSHEDVDQFFSQMSNLLESHSELHTPLDFVRVLQQWLSNPDVRPHERTRFVRKVDQVRAWHLALQIVSGC